MKLSHIRWIFISLVIIFSGLFLFYVKSIIPSFLVGLVLAYLLSPGVTWLEKRGLKRAFAVAVMFTCIIIILTLLLFLLLPKLYIEIGKLAIVLPDRIQNIYEYGQNAKMHYAQSGLPSEVTKLIDEQLLQGQAYLINWLESIIQNLPSLLASIGLMILSPILAIYFLLDWKKITEAIINLVPGKVRGQWYKFLQEMDYIVQRYIQGNMIDALIVAFLIGVSVRLLGMEYALVIGVICGITNLIPYFGPLLGGIPSVLLALSKSPAMGLKVALIIFIVQQIDGNIINPRLMSDKVGLHPLWVVFALLAGGELGGLVGMLIAIPLAAILRLIFRETFFYLVSPRVFRTRRD